jgi:hypothetical protein
MGYMRYSRASVLEAAGNTPVMMLTSPKSDASPEFEIYGEWQVGDELQFQRQGSGGDWSAATTATHTVTSGEIAGTAINFGLATLAEGNYEYRARYKHAGGNYSEWSPIESGVVSFNLVLNYIAQVVWAGAGGQPVFTQTNIPIGSSYPNRRIYLFGVFTDVGSGRTVTSVAFNGSTVGVTLTQSGAGESLRWMATALIPTGTTLDITLTYSSGAFQKGFASLYHLDNSLLLSATPVDVKHTHTTGVNTGTLPLVTSAAGAAVFMGVLYGGTSSTLTISPSSSDPWTKDADDFSYTNWHALDTLSRTTSVIATWATTDGEGYLTAWSIR